jgi:bacteriocin-like protein
MNGNKVINYLDDGTFEVISDAELMAVVGGVAVASEPTNSGCNTGCNPNNVGC